MASKDDRDVTRWAPKIPVVQACPTAAVTRRMRNLDISPFRGPRVDGGPARQKPELLPYQEILRARCRAGEKTGNHTHDHDMPMPLLSKIRYSGCTLQCTQEHGWCRDMIYYLPRVIYYIQVYARQRSCLKITLWLSYVLSSHHSSVITLENYSGYLLYKTI